MKTADIKVIRPNIYAHYIVFKHVVFVKNRHVLQVKDTRKGNSIKIFSILKIWTCSLFTQKLNIKTQQTQRMKINDYKY